VTFSSVLKKEVVSSSETSVDFYLRERNAEFKPWSSKIEDLAIGWQHAQVKRIIGIL
jgi:hypothetical protein